MSMSMPAPRVTALLGEQSRYLELKRPSGERVCVDTTCSECASPYTTGMLWKAVSKEALFCRSLPVM